MVRKTTTQRGLGWDHQKQRERLLRAHVDGTPCPRCHRPMYREAAANWDGRPLHADHTLARSKGGTIADRLMCATCNESRGDGSRDRRRAVGLSDSVIEQSKLWTRDWLGLGNWGIGKGYGGRKITSNDDRP